MKEIPTQLQCAYCKRNNTHGGECTEVKSYYDPYTCLFFTADERGCIRNTDLKVPIELYSNIPLIGEWNSNYVLNGTDTEIRINKIYGLSWDKKAGILLIHSNCDYYINEYHEDYKEPSKKPVLKVVK